MKNILAGLSIASLFSIGLVATSSAASEVVCVEDSCTVSFSHSGAAQTWKVPDGVEALFVELRGGQGGSAGGKGGFISAWLEDLPEQLEIYVGGMGESGARRDGGFNGGGKSGGRYGSPGGGGGASDIRFGSELEDRVIVAGGGGGTGGPSGGTGGAGGGLVAEDGSAGQGGSGAAGSQLSGGSGGVSNGTGIDGYEGEFGIGGAGGFLDSGAGGGGGGGGYFGGGGGGADRDVCCLDAGGGGGGSSYADPERTNNVEHVVGDNTGHGSVKIHYSMPAELTVFQFTQQTVDQALVDIQFNKAVSGLELDDLNIQGCQQANLTGEASSYQLFLDDCQSSVDLVMLAGAVYSFGSVPKQDVNLSGSLVQQGSEIVVSGPDIVSSSSARFLITANGGLDSSFLRMSACDHSSNIDESVMQVDFFNCPEGEVTFSVDRGFSFDSFGNLGPSTNQMFSFRVDTKGPELSFEDPQSEAISLNGAQISFAQVDVSSTDPVSIESIQFIGEEGCIDAFRMTDNGLSLLAFGCPAGEVSWTIPAHTQFDAAGNSGPSEELVVTLEVSAVSNESQVEPQAPMPFINPDPPQQAPIPSEPPSSDDVDQAKDEPEVQQESTLSEANSTVEGDSGENLGGIDVATNLPEPEADDVVLSETIAEPNLTERAAEISSGQNSSFPWIRVTLAGLMVLGLVVLVIWLTKNYSSRPID